MYPFLAHLKRDKKCCLRTVKSDISNYLIYLTSDVTFQMRLQNKQGTWQNTRPSHIFCTSSQTGHLLPLCLWLFFCSVIQREKLNIMRLTFIPMSNSQSQFNVTYTPRQPHAGQHTNTTWKSRSLASTLGSCCFDWTVLTSLGF